MCTDFWSMFLHNFCITKEIPCIHVDFWESSKAWTVQFQGEMRFAFCVCGFAFDGRISALKFDLRKGQVENNGKKRTHV